MVLLNCPAMYKLLFGPNAMPFAPCNSLPPTTIVPNDKPLALSYAVTVLLLKLLTYKTEAENAGSWKNRPTTRTSPGGPDHIFIKLLHFIGLCSTKNLSPFGKPDKVLVTPVSR